jgi:hypothetical protein
MEKLENLVRNKRQEFDQAEPSEGHFERFQYKLADAGHPRRSAIRLRNILRIAAVILIIVAVSFSINYFNLLPDALVKNSAASELPPELKDVEVYYTSLTGEKLQQIEHLSDSKEEADRIRKQAMHEVNELENSTLELQREYVAGGKNERVLDAIVNNYRIISSLLDHIISELSTETSTESTSVQPS